MFSGIAQVSQKLCQFSFVSSVCLVLRVNMVDKSKALVFCLLSTWTINVIRKDTVKCGVRSGIWYMKRKISCDAHLLECLETMPSWDRQVN
jgi:hypothetical protein